MRRAKRILLIATVLLVSLSDVYGSLWRHRKADVPAADSAPAAAAMSLTAVEADSSSPSRLLLRTSGAPAYTSYSPSPDVFVVDLTETSKAPALTMPSSFPAGVASVSVDDVTEMGNRLTRVTLHLTQPGIAATVSAGDSSVMVTLPALTASGEPPAVPVIPVLAAADPVAAPIPSAQSADAPVVTKIIPKAEPPVRPADAPKSAEIRPAAPDVPALTEPPAPAAEPAVTAEALPLPKATVLKSVGATGKGSTLEVQIAGDGDLSYNAFRLEGPSRLVIDLNGVRNGVGKNVLPVNDGVVRKIRVAQFKGAPEPVTRIVLDLDQSAQYRVTKDGQRLRIGFGDMPALAASASIAPAPETSVAHEAPVAPSRAVATTASTPVVPVAVPSAAPAASTLVVSEPAVVPAVEQPKPAAKSEPAKVAAADISSQVPVIPENAPPPWKPEPASKGATRIINAPADQTPPATNRARRSGSAAAPNEDVFADPPAPQTTSGTSQVLSSNSQAGGRTLSSGEKIYTGEPLSLNLKDADIKDVLRTFSQLTGLNIAIDPNVGGSVTVDFTDVPWDQALELILKQNGLTYILEGNVMRVGTLDRISAETAATRRLAEEERLNVQLQTISFKLSYARAGDVQTLLREIASPRARIIIDARTNQLIISEIPQYLQTMRNLIDSIDVPTRQVVIEARIVETTKNFLQQYGFRWGFNGSLDPSLGTGTGLVFPSRVNLTGGPFDFGPGNPVLAMTLGNVLGTFDLDLALNAAESEGIVKVISAPRVTTQDNTAAEIQSGFQIPYQTRINFTTTVTYVDATLRLSVTPQITEAGTVIMEIAVNKTEPALGLAIAGGAGTPLATRQAKTRLMVRDGGTSVIGGIYQTRENNAQSRLPFVHQIPILGNLFKEHNISTTHDELLIFITPRIVRG